MSISRAKGLNMFYVLILLWSLRTLAITAANRPFRRKYFLHLQSLPPTTKKGLVTTYKIARFHNTPEYENKPSPKIQLYIFWIISSSKETNLKNHIAFIVENSKNHIAFIVGNSKKNTRWGADLHIACCNLEFSPRQLQRFHHPARLRERLCKYFYRLRSLRIVAQTNSPEHLLENTGKNLDANLPTLDQPFKAQR